MSIIPQLIVNALITGSIYALASAGLALTYGLLKVLNFAHGHLMMLGAYFFYLFYVEQNLGLPLAVIATCVLVLLSGVVIFRVFIQPFSRLSIILTLVTTLALANILESIVSMVFGVNVKSLSTGIGISSIQFGSVYITPIQILIIVSGVILLCLLSYTIHSTSFGRRIRALSEHPHAAESIAISQKQTSYGVFLIGMLLAAYAGILIGFESNIQPTMGASYTIKAFAAMILGGLGNVWGAVLGSYILGIVENFSIGLDFGGYSIPAGYKDAFAFLIILLMLLFRPQGLFGTKQRVS